jgi:hypothetical protein
MGKVQTGLEEPRSLLDWKGLLRSNENNVGCQIL